MRNDVQVVQRFDGDEIVKRWLAILDKSLRHGFRQLPVFGRTYAGAILDWLDTHDAGAFRLSLPQLLSADGTRGHEVSRLQELLYHFKQAFIAVALRREWQVEELNDLHARLDEAIVLTLRHYASVFELLTSGSVGQRQHVFGVGTSELTILEDLLASIGATALLVNSDRNIVWANRLAQERYGTLERLRRLSCYRAVWGFQHVCDDCGVSEFRSLTPQRRVQLRVRPDGSKEYVEAVIVPVRDHQGQVTHALEVMFDITEAKQTEERLQAREEVLGAVVRDCADAILTMDSAGNIQSWNAGAEALFGYSRGEILGRHFSLLVPPHLNEQGELAMLERKVLQDGSVRDFETERVRKDGKRLRVSVTRSLLRDSHGNRIGTSAVVRDITQRKTWELQLAHADRLATMGTMAAGLAHEIGNPLGAISSVVQLLQRQIDDPKLKQRLELVREQVSRITRIVREMADFSRPKGQSDARVQVSDVIQHAVTLARYSRMARRVEVHVSADPNLPPLRVDAERLLQVFLNLVLNAYDAMAGRGELEIRAACAGRVVSVAFADSGPGVPLALRDRIFEPFFTTKATGYGTGMGLSVSQRIVQTYGGTITVSEAATGGAVFTVTLPVS